MKNYKIAVAGTGYVGLSLGVLLSQHHQVVAVDIVQAKVDMINNKKSPIQDDYIEKYLAEKDLNLTATLDAKTAYSDADFVVIAAPTNYDSKTQHFDTSAVEAVIKLVMEYRPYTRNENHIISQNELDAVYDEFESLLSGVEETKIKSSQKRTSNDKLSAFIKQFAIQLYDYAYKIKSAKDSRNPDAKEQACKELKKHFKNYKSVI